MGVHPGAIKTDFGNIMMKELTVIGTYGYVWTSWQRTVRLLAEGKLEHRSHDLSRAAARAVQRRLSHDDGWLGDQSDSQS